MYSSTALQTHTILDLSSSSSSSAWIGVNFIVLAMFSGFTVLGQKHGNKL
jgi:hypothetical protein